MIKASEVREIIIRGRRAWEIFTTPEAVRAAVAAQGDYPEICLTIVEATAAELEEAEALALLEATAPGQRR